MEKEYLIKIKIAEEFIEAAKINLKSSLRTSANRVYFALEKAIESYLLYMERRIPKNHQKIWELSFELLGKEYYNLLRILYDLRMQADYGTASIIVPFNEDIVKKNLDKTEILIKNIKNKLVEPEIKVQNKNDEKKNEKRDEKK